MTKLNITEVKDKWVSFEALKETAQDSVFVALFPNSKNENNSAVVYQKKHYTYRDISTTGLRLVSFMLECMTSKKEAFKPLKFQDTYRVAICVQPGPGSLALLNACLASGVLTIFIDPDQKSSKSCDILDDFQPDLIFGPTKFRSQISENIVDEGEFRVIESDEDIVNFANAFSKATRFPPFNEVKPALVIYTSGSTGTPKGVVLSHLNLSSNVNLSSSISNLARCKEGHLASTVFLGSWQTSAISVIFFCARNNGRIYITNKSQTNFPTRFASFLAENHITTISGPASYIKLLFDTGLLKTSNTPFLQHIRLWGERIEPSLIDTILTHLPSSSITTIYASSESMFSSFVCYSDAETAKNECVYQVNSPLEFKFIKEDVSSKYARLKITGPNVMMGYWSQIRDTNLPEQGSPMNSFLFEDWIKPVSDNSFTVAGRIDNIVKIVGKKVSLSEVESIIQDHTEVEQACVFAKADHRGITRVHAAVVSHSKKINKTSVISHCRKNLPVEAIPFTIELYSSFPRLSSGKIDRRSIEKLDPDVPV